MPDMTPAQQINDQKARLEATIAASVKGFQDATGCVVTGVAVQNAKSGTQVVLVDVKVEVKV